MNETAVGGPTVVEEVRAAWADALDVDIEAVPLDVSFFDAGGNSLLLLLLWEQLNDLTPRDLRAADLFRHNTVQAQVRLITDEQSERQMSVLGARDRHRLLGRARSGRSSAAGS